MWFWVGLALVLLWGAWGYLRRRWWLAEIDRSLARMTGGAAATHYAAPHRISVPDRIVTAVAGAAAIIGVFLLVANRWGWFV